MENIVKIMNTESEAKNIGKLFIFKVKIAKKIYKRIGLVDIL